ncbi:hypothetical protein JDV09_11625 [Mycobacterium sp. Y57]|uniref:sunset domain-containing protein n=1 Tax=Mycolicibacterium xanthum TaxID=2796469 RepID=UPI001C865E22|nr:hypothetical protein [Mycolicibacterium xanthum]MBX7432748.1 hypothetical protein [Mycolicibacterium xanthum]
MSRQHRLRLGFGRAAIGLLGIATALLLAPAAVAQPEVEANDAITAAWQASGGDTGPLGTRSGDVYPVGAGFAQNFASGKMFFTPATGAHFMQGAILEKYESLGGPADSDLGFPTIDEGPGRAPDSLNSTFSAPDSPVIFWTPATGARVVRGPINEAWDKLGGSSGVLGVPVEDETYDGAVVSQKFGGGEVTYDGRAKTFTTVPPELADQLADLSIADDPVAAINAARRAAGGPLGPLGAAEGDPYPIGDDGMGQDFVNGKIFYSPDTGANVVTGQVLEKYDSVGGPEGDLGFPVTSEADGGLAPASRVSKFAAADQPVIFWTPDYGAVIVRGAMNAAWEKLGGATGDLGAPASDESRDGDVITQKFAGGAISYNTKTNKFSTEPGSLASQLAGLEVPGEGAPQAPPAETPQADEGTGFQWNWWWLLAILPVLVLIGVVVFAVARNRGRGGEDPFAHDGDETPGFPPAPQRPEGGDGGEDELFGDRYAREGLGSLTAAAPGASADEFRPGHADFWGAGSDEPGAPSDVEEEDPDTVDTTPTRIPTLAEIAVGPAPSDDHLEEPDDHPEEFEGYVKESEGDLEESEGYLQESGEPVGEPDGEIDEPAGELVEEASPEPPAQQRDLLTDTGRHAAIDIDQPTPGGTALHMPFDDPHRIPADYPVKADTRSGLFWTPDCADYGDAPVEIYFASEEMALTMGFVRGS